MRAAALLLALSVPAFAQPKIDSDRLVFHLKETRLSGLPPDVNIQIGKVEKSEMAGLWKVTVELARGEQKQTVVLLVSEDGKRYIMGEVSDLTKLPDQDVLTKLKTDGAPAKGGKNAKIVVVEFTDFQCPWCKKAHESLEASLFKTYGDRVRVVFKHFPLNMHPWAEPAGVAAACVQKIAPAQFWAFTDAVFKNQDEINLAVHGADRKSMDLAKFKEKALLFAKEAKVDAKKFEACYDKQETLDIVKKDVAEGDALGVNSTPTLFVNGHKVGGGFEAVKPIIDEMLAGTHGPPVAATE